MENWHKLLFWDRIDYQSSSDDDFNPLLNWTVQRLSQLETWKQFRKLEMIPANNTWTEDIETMHQTKTVDKSCSCVEW